MSVRGVLVPLGLCRKQAEVVQRPEPRGWAAAGGAEELALADSCASCVR
ncbi:hypothetical protein ACFO9E_05510 [Streptomyces maoxianensis]|uniref:Uncharacterized protein n=1 Tax=Streptomyces maoxianensis TaxID=1459942 RepID=A0ABV9G040_9ACTN